MTERPTMREVTRVELAEYAEALGVSTDTIMGANTDDGGQTWQVLYTPDGFEPKDPVRWARIWVDPTGVMEVVDSMTLMSIEKWTKGLNSFMGEVLKAYGEGEGDA